LSYASKIARRESWNLREPWIECQEEGRPGNPRKN